MLAYVNEVLKEAAKAIRKEAHTNKKKPGKKVMVTETLQRTPQAHGKLQSNPKANKKYFKLPKQRRFFCAIEARLGIQKRTNFKSTRRQYCPQLFKNKIVIAEDWRRNTAQQFIACLDNTPPPWREYVSGNHSLYLKESRRD